ncbi:hypothetical protein LX32DRAFT_692236 [Colletotrichum zoysiae]|uniref:Mid2 domain-containing protein n=1 Tax=Colletotrichum zoysiae TaxID=1216348 RepID=A0AAD9HMP3_9PEZI|nr:hypothetical protein LX32DRAFT_692236 [Colletotrichum zoysiae]
MRSPTLLLFALVTSVLGQILNPALGQFIHPSQEGETWKVGEKKKIVFNTTLRHFTVGLWQQASPSAVLGGVVFRMGGFDKVDAKTWAREFDWEVQTYGLDLSVSNVAYFWLFEGTDGNQGNQTLRHIFSASFIISDANPASGSTPSRTSTTRQEPTKTVVLSKTAPAGPSGSPPAQTTVSPLPLSPGQSEGASSADTSMTSGNLPIGTVEGSGPTRTAGERWPASTGGDRAVHAGEADETDSNRSSTGLPVGTKAGIGVGVGIFGIACIACAVMFYKHLKTKKRALAEPRESTMADPPPYFHGVALSPVSPVSAVQSPTKSTPGATGFYVNPKPVEIA